MVYGKDGRRPRVLVTGAAAGVGRTLARMIALHDVELILADSSGEELSATARELNAHGIFCDPDSAASVEIFASALKDRFNSLHGLVNAAGAGHHRTLGMIRMSASLLPLMRHTMGSKLIVNVAPETGSGPVSEAFAFASSACATNAFSSYLRSQVRGTTIAVETIAEAEVPGEHFAANLLEPCIANIIRVFDDGRKLDQATPGKRPAATVRRAPAHLSRAGPSLRKFGCRGRRHHD